MPFSPGTHARRGSDYYAGLVRELTSLPQETEWLELKVENKNPQEIGEYISALSNAAMYVGKDHGYLIWGIRDDDHAVVGTRFDPGSEHIGNEALENWLLRRLNPRINFRFESLEISGSRIVILEIDRASRVPVAFGGTEYIRVGSYKKKLKEFPEKERALWKLFDQTAFELGIAEERISLDEVMRTLDYSAYFDQLGVPQPDGHAAILEALIRERLITNSPAGGYDITNLGAILFAKNIGDFPTLSRKAVRVIQYEGRDRTAAVRERLEQKGYASGFEYLIDYVDALVPSREFIDGALRRTISMLPKQAIRELVANALIHQDFTVRGAGPTIELFEDRLEITNPGEPLVDTARFLDNPPASRNEALASLMRRLDFCEERGSGIDKVVALVEQHQLPAPLFEVPPGFTRVVLFAHRPLRDMDKEDRIRACYLHACLKYVGRSFLTNASLRERLGIKANNRAVITRFIRDALDAGAIAVHDPNAGPRHKKYVPWWAAPDRAVD